MSYVSCDKCTEGTICRDCGKPRGQRAPKGRWGNGGGHGLCSRGRDRLQPCPAHVVRGIKCDYCGVFQEGWEPRMKSHERGHACAKCEADLAIASDAVGGFDIDSLGPRVVDHLIKALGRIDWSKLSQAQRVALSDALDKCRP